MATATQQEKSKYSDKEQQEISAQILPEYELKVRNAQNAADEVGIRLAHEQYQEAREQRYEDRKRVEKQLERERKQDEKDSDD